MQEKYLITTDGWFICPDGSSYRSVWGEVQILPDSILGVATNSRSSNWFAKVGNESNHVIIAGCQIHYAVRCELRPSDKGGKTWSFDNGEVKIGETPNAIYCTE